MQQGFQQHRMGTLGRIAIFGIALRFFYASGPRQVAVDRFAWP